MIMSKEHVCYNCRTVFEKPEADKAKEEKEVTRCPQCGSVDIQKLGEQDDHRFIRRMSFG
jgi:predicted  nucleic acid-binding Zn-ribbon protein